MFGIGISVEGLILGLLGVVISVDGGVTGCRDVWSMVKLARPASSRVNEE